MLYIKTKNRLKIFLAISIFSILIIVLIFKSLEDNVLYFYSPSEIKENGDIKFNKNIRIGGMVKNGSISTIENEIKFIVTDFKNDLFVSYSGTVPNLFSEGKGVVAEGKLQDKNFFIADRILAKHDEKYMPPELKSLIKKNVK